MCPVSIKNIGCPVLPSGLWLRQLWSRLTASVRAVRLVAMADQQHRQSSVSQVTIPIFALARASVPECQDWMRR